MEWSRNPALIFGGMIALLCADAVVVGQDSVETHQLTDQAEQRQRSNAEFVNVPVEARISERFEMYDPRSEEEIRELKAMGFTQVILDRPNLHAAATQVGLDVVLANWWIDRTAAEKIERGIGWARKVDRNSLVGFSVMDEPGRNSPDTPFDYYVDLYEQLVPRFREQFPATKIEISHWGPMAGWNQGDYEKFSTLYRAADVMRIMPYPDLHEAALDDVFFMIQRSRKLMKIAGRELPLVVILQAWTLPPDNKLPEIAELRVMAWQAMLSGADVVSFFEYNLDIWNQTAGFHEEFRQLMAELTEFSSRHRGYQAVSTMNGQGMLTSILTSPTGQKSCVEINTRRKPSAGFKSLEIRTTPKSSPHPPDVSQFRHVAHSGESCLRCHSCAKNMQFSVTASIETPCCRSRCIKRRFRRRCP